MIKYNVMLGLGSNVGDRRAQLRAAVRALSADVECMQVSTLFESAALLPAGAPKEWNVPFYNLVLLGQTSLAPRGMLAVVKRLESELGRQVRGHWGPREVDIDVLAMDDLIVNEPDFIVPHKEMHKRDFVMLPLMQIAPDWQHPILQKSARELVEQQGFRLSGILRDTGERVDV